jgi:hypothetical protein
VDFLEGLAQVVGDVDTHSLPVTGNINLTAKPQSPPPPPHCIVHVEVPQVALELCVAVLQIKEALRGSNKRDYNPTDTDIQSR